MDEASFSLFVVVFVRSLSGSAAKVQGAVFARMIAKMIRHVID